MSDAFFFAFQFSASQQGQQAPQGPQNNFNFLPPPNGGLNTSQNDNNGFAVNFILPPSAPQSQAPALQAPGGDPAQFATAFMAGFQAGQMQSANQVNGLYSQMQNLQAQVDSYKNELAALKGTFATALSAIKDFVGNNVQNMKDEIGSLKQLLATLKNDSAKNAKKTKLEKLVDKTQGLSPDTKDFLKKFVDAYVDGDQDALEKLITDDTQNLSDTDKKDAYNFLLNVLVDDKAKEVLDKLDVDQPQQPKFI